MSVKFRIADQVLKVADTRESTEAVVHKYDAFLNVLCGDRYAFQREATREALRFLVSDQYPDLERLARENWQAREPIRQRHEDNLDAYLGTMPLRDRKSVSLDLATGTGKSYVMYALAAIALGEGLADRVLVLCPSLTIEDGLLEKFTRLAGDAELSGIMKELGAIVPIPSIKRGNETIKPGDICVENIHATSEKTGFSIRDSFRGNGPRTLVLNDEAHHLFSPPERALKEWLKFLQHPDFEFRMMVNVTGTPYVDDEYFPDVVCRYGLKQAIEGGIVKKPDYKLEETNKAHDWQKTYAIHERNRKDCGNVKPITIVVTRDIARCVEVWRELVDFLAEKKGVSREEAAKKAIWVASGVPSAGEAKGRVEAAYFPRDDTDSAERQRKANLALLKRVDEPDCPVEWICSVAMLSEGWDVKNVFQIVPHESRAFNSRLLIAQVLGRGLRVPPGFASPPLVRVNNHEKFSPEIGELLKDVLETERTLTWGYEPRREQYVFPLHNLCYEPKQTTVETRHEQAKAPDTRFGKQERTATDVMKFSETGLLTVDFEHKDLFELDDAVKLLYLSFREKNPKIAAEWPKKRLRKFIEDRLKAAGQGSSFLSKENLLKLQQGFGPMFRALDVAHPRLSQTAGELIAVDLRTISGQWFSESSLREHGAVWYADEASPPFGGHELLLWKDHQRYREQYARDGAESGDMAQAIGSRLHPVKAGAFKTPWNVHFVSHEPERKFSELLFARAELFDAFVKMPNSGGYAFPYSYKPAKAAKTHVANENFNPDFFLKVKDGNDILCVEVKEEGDDSNRNRAKYRDGQEHFDTLNERLKVAGEPWHYEFYFLSPDDFGSFFRLVQTDGYRGWKSGLMLELMK